MDNMYEPPGGDPKEDSRPTEQFWPVSPGPDASHGPRYHQPGYQDPRSHDPRSQGPRSGRPHGGPGDTPRRRHPLSWTVGLVAAAALAAGGIAAGISLASHSSPAAGTSAAGTSTAAGSAAAPGPQAAALNTALNSAGDPGSLALTSSSGAAGVAGASAAGTAATAHPCAAALRTARAARQAGHPAVARAARAAAGARCRGLRHRFGRVALLRGIDGQFTFRGMGGTIRTLAFERGVVQSVSGSDVVVQAADGTIWTWDLVSSTVVRENGSKTSQSALATGEPVWVGGPVLSGVKDARLVVIKPPSGGAASSSPSPAASSSPAAGS
jgi:hypothetical protein